MLVTRMYPVHLQFKTGLSFKSHVHLTQSRRKEWTVVAADRCSLSQHTKMEEQDAGRPCHVLSGTKRVGHA